MTDRVFMGRYHTTQFLGEGGMSNVWLAREQGAGRRVVVKVMKGEFLTDPKCREAFRREIDFLKTFRHPFAVEFYQASLNDPAGPCLAIEYVEGKPLDRLLQETGRLSPDRVGNLLGKLCAMLHALHGLGYVHRDLKPANVVMLGAGTPAETIKVLDFGLTRKLVEQSETPYIPIEKITQFTQGTPDYMSPEQLGGGPLDYRSDLYSVGVMLYEMLTGARPFKGKDVAEVLLAHAEQPPPPFSKKDGISPVIESIVLLCLAKKPESRPPTARDLAMLYGQALRRPIWDEKAAAAMKEATDESAHDAVLEHPTSAADPDEMNYQLQAWMPQQIAEMKIRGFLNDLGGEVTESLPGMIRVYLKRPRPAAAKAAEPGGFLSWLGLGKKTEAVEEADLIEMEVHMTKAPASDRANQLLIAIRLRQVRGMLARDWSDWCDKIVREISAYLMAKPV